MRRRGLGASLAFLLATWVAAAAIQNGDFSAGLHFWKASWNVTVSSGEAALSDTGANHAFLFQAAAIPPGVYTVEFDFKSALSAVVPAGAFRDSFYASLYSVNALSDFVLEQDSFDAAQGLLDLDSAGPFNVHGTLGASSKSAAWSHYTGIFTNSYSNVVAVFELYDLNTIAGDSSVGIDNVQITPVQVP